METMVKQSLKEKMSECRVTQAQIADALGVRDSLVCRVIAGRTASARVVEAIAAALKMNVDEVKAAIPSHGGGR